MPLFHAHPDASGDRTREAGDGAMKTKPQALNELSLTSDALAALRRSGFSRRSFLQGTGALIVTFSMGGVLGTMDAQAQGGLAPDSPPANEVDSWIAIAADGSVTAYTGKEEIGQGMSTAQMQLVAEELCVPFNRVNLLYCDTSMTPDQGVTSGSQSHPANFNHSNLAQAGATARQALLQLASKRLSVPVDQLTAADGVIRAKSDGVEESDLRRTGGGEEVRPQGRPQRQAEISERVDRARKADAASRHARHGHRAI